MAITSCGFSIVTMMRAASCSFSHVLPTSWRGGRGGRGGELWWRKRVRAGPPRPWPPGGAPVTHQHVDAVAALAPDVVAHARVHVLGAQVRLRRHQHLD